ncbi:MAG: hypothetical protein ACREXY_28875, partial [Gammaproteobacteria bacterium]
MSDFAEKRTDDATRALITRVQEDIRVVNLVLKPLLETVETLAKKVTLLGEEISALIAHKEYAVTWLKLGALAVVVVSACWMLVRDARAEMRAELDKAKIEMAAKISKAEERVDT